MSNPKVFEFAKEVGMTPLALLDKLKEWQLPVKSHMAELEPEILEQVRVRLAQSSKPTSATRKAPVARKKAAPAAPAAPITTNSRKAKAAPAEEPAPMPKAAAAGTVVRRKKTAEIEAAKVEALKAESARENVVVTEVLPENNVVEAAVQSIPEAEVVEAPVQPIVEVSIEAPKAATVEIQAKKLEPAAPEPVREVAPVKPPPVFDSSDKKIISRKKEVSIGSSGVTSEPSASATAVKRNIIGRMDLSRVTPPPRQGGAPYRAGPPPVGGRPGFPGGSTQPGGAGFAANRNKGTLRPGFIKAAPIAFELPSENDFERKKEDRKKAKNPGSAEGVTRAATEEQPKLFDAAEFRKREMVFQPKKKKGMLSRPSLQTQITQPAAHKRVIKVYGAMKVADLANEMGLKAAELIKILMKNGITSVNINSDLDFETIALIVPEHGFEAQNSKKTADEILSAQKTDTSGDEQVTRAPVVTVMGHVDHGKTSLLDAIRKADVAGGEAGGITQHIGAYQVALPDGRNITFLDTPGHEAFTAMRARGAQVTDIAVIVVAADDGVMPQTIEAISHARAAEVPLIIAVNKIDKPGANVERIKQQLTEYQVVPEEWGGDAIYVEVSALKKTGIDRLLEQILLIAEVAELKANPKLPGTGTVIEARLDKGRGSVATLLVQNGTIEIGQHLVAGAATGKVRSLTNDKGERVKSAGPGSPVEILGLDSVPGAGDRFDVVKNEEVAAEVAQVRIDQVRQAQGGNTKMSLEQIMAKISRGDQKELSIVLKTDVAGSLEAIQGMFTKLATAEVKIRIVHSAIGGITESDVLLASTSKGLIIGFNVRPDGGASQQAKRMGVEIRSYTIVYELIDDMKKAMAGLLQPDIVEKVMGRAEVRNIFSIPKIGTIAGSFVLDGKIQRNNLVRLIRDGKIIYTGVLASLKRFKDDTKEVAHGFECGIGIENYNDVKVGDVIEAFVKEEVARELSSPSQSNGQASNNQASLN